MAASDATVPNAADELFAARPEDFVRERTALARALRAEGRGDEADVVGALRKPPAAVLAVNRAAREQPKEARSAADAAARLAKAQLSGDRLAYEAATAALESALGALADAAVAHLSDGARGPSEGTRQRIRELLRAAVSDEGARDLLARGVLTEEVETRGFDAFAGLPVPKKKARTPTARNERSSRAKEHQARERELRQRIREAEQSVRDAEKAVRAAERQRDGAARSLEALRAELERP